MAKCDLDQVEFSMKAVNIPEVDIQKVIADLKAAMEQDKADKEKKEKVSRTKYIIANPNGATSLGETPMVVIDAVDDDVTHTQVIEAISTAAAQANNEVKKLKMIPLDSVFDAVQGCPAKYLKQNGIRAISKEITMVLETDNKLLNQE